MKLRVAGLNDYNELVAMYKDLVHTVYDGMKIGEDIFFHGVVTQWYQTNKDIVICETDDGKIAGFTLAYKEDLGIIEPYYFGDIAYVKPEYRKTRAAYLLYHNVVEYGKKLGLKVQAKAFIGGGNKERIDKLQGRFGSPQFVEYRTE